MPPRPSLTGRCSVGHTTGFAAIDNAAPVDQTHTVSSPLIVLNGPSSAGKSSIIRELQDLWPRPLFATGIDAFIVGWPLTHVAFPGEDGATAAGAAIRIVPGHGPAPSWIPEYGDEFHQVLRLANESWVAMCRNGIDVIVDHVIVDETMREQARTILAGAFWVGVTCDVDELVRREEARGDRYRGFASGTFAVVHRGMDYDMVVDTTSTPSDVVAREIRDALIGR